MVATFFRKGRDETEGGDLKKDNDDVAVLWQGETAYWGVLGMTCSAHVKRLVIVKHMQS
jgi:hypothetical protein